jgi:uncharacterized protein (DUF1778 family)
MRTPNIPQRISILTPLPKGLVPRGRNENYKGSDPQRTFRCADAKWETIVSAAELLGCTTPEFIRWVSYAAANEVLRQAEVIRRTPQSTTIELDQSLSPTLMGDDKSSEETHFVRKVVNPYSR